MDQSSFFRPSNLGCWTNLATTFCRRSGVIGEHSSHRRGTGFYDQRLDSGMYGWYIPLGNMVAPYAVENSRGGWLHIMTGQRRRKETIICGQPLTNVNILAAWYLQVLIARQIRHRDAKVDNLVSIYVAKVNRHMPLLPKMRDWFIFRLTTDTIGP